MPQRITVALYGKPTLKVVDGTSRRVIPLLGAHEGRIGIGYLIPGMRSNDPWQSTIWCLAVQNTILHAWRCMKILEGSGCINLESVCACWTASDSEILQLNDVEESHVCHLRDGMGSIEAYTTLRDAVRALYPTGDEVDTIAANLHLAGISVGTEDLVCAAKEAHIPLTPLIKRLKRNAEEHRLYSNRGQGLHTTIAILDDFCEYLRIAGLLEGMPDMNWHYIEVGEIELLHELSGIDGLKKYLDHIEEYFFEDVKVFYGRVAHNVVEQPQLVTKNGDTYQFLHARIVNGEILIRTRVTYFPRKEVHEAEYPLNFLYVHIGLPYNRPIVKSFCGFLK